MGAAIGDILGPAVGVALSPIPIVAVILMLFTPRARVNAPLFLAGWIVGLVVIGVVVLATGLGAAEDSSSNTRGGLDLALGALLLVLAVRNWRQRPRHGEPAELPGWMEAIDRVGAGKAFGLGAGLSGVNPKNLVLALAAATTVADAGLSGGEEAVAYGVFVVLASLTVALPVLAYLALGARADETLTEWKEWLVAHNHAVMAAVLLVLGVKLLGDGIAGLSG